MRELCRRIWSNLKKIGLATTSQTPRDDVVPSLRKMIGRSVDFVQAGALDDLTKQEILKLTPKNDSDVLVSRARDGSEIMFGKSHIISRLQKSSDDLNAKRLRRLHFFVQVAFRDSNRRHL
jgi:protein AroM